MGTLVRLSPQGVVREEDNLFGGWSYMPITMSDPGYNPLAPNGVQDTFSYAGDPEDAVPEPPAAFLFGVGLVVLFFARQGASTVEGT